MPGISGFELPGLLARAGHHVPVIFVTAHDTPETRQRAQSVGAAGYFRKPVDDQALLDAIAWAIGGGRAA
jgi:FixJ family two-component response regulator